MNQTNDTNKRIAGACGTANRWVLMKRGLYWRPNAHGYTPNLDEAWILTEEEADKYVYPHDEPVTKHLAPYPNYTESLDAMAEAENVLHGLGKWQDYLKSLWKTVNQPPYSFEAITHVENFLAWNFIHATAAQRAAAFLAVVEGRGE